jgi:SEC-C motif
MSQKPERNAPCPCGSGRKFKKCCINLEISDGLPISSRMTEEGLHMMVPGLPPTPLEVGRLTAVYQDNLRKSALWPKMVAEFGEEKAEALLKQCRME